MEPLRLSVALCPLAVYLLLLGLLNLSRRPFLTTGARDLYALGVSISGFVIVGPMELFMPQAAAARFGPFVWPLLLAFCVLCLTLVVLLVRPRLVIYNMTPDQVRPLLASVVSRNGLEHHWAGDCLALPNWGVQLQVEKFSFMRNVSLVATSAEQSYQGWRELERQLAAELSQADVSPNPIGVSFVTFSILVFGVVLFRLLSDPTAVAAGLLDLLRL